KLAWGIQSSFRQPATPFARRCRGRAGLHGVGGQWRGRGYSREKTHNQPWSLRGVFVVCEPTHDQRAQERESIMGVFKGSDEDRSVWSGKLKHWERGWIKVSLQRDKRASERQLGNMQADSDRVAAGLLTPEEWSAKWKKERRKKEDQGQ